MSLDATTYDKIAVPDQTSACLNCGKPGTTHVDDKCLFEASQFEASTHHYPFAKYREIEIPESSPFAMNAWTTIWRFNG